MKKTVKFFIIVFLFITYIYICKINSIPKKILIFNGENLKDTNFFGLSLNIKDENNQTIQASNNLNKEEKKQNIAEVKLFNTFTVKEIGLDLLEETKVIPVGQISGLKLYTSGVLVVGMSEIKDEKNQKHKPYENSGIEEGDRIIKINNQEISDTQELTNFVNQSKGEKLEIVYMRNEEEKNTNIIPIKSYDKTYKLGLWVRDSAAGIGTLTFYEPTTGKFAALGHGITDTDTGELIKISNGEFLTTKILSIVKGLKGNPGKIKGSIEGQQTIGTIYKNSNLGIYGTVNNLSVIKIDLLKEMKVANRNEITLGEAYIYFSIRGEKPKEYKIEIEKIFINNNYDNKSMLIEVKDEELLNLTGGIIQGMSGSPIIQNGKFIGAVTNVLVNDPKHGYAIFGDLMIKEMGF